MRGPEVFGWLFLGGGGVFALHAISSLIEDVIASRTWPCVTARVVSRDAESVGQTEYGEPLWYPTVRFGDTTLQLADSMSEAESRVGAKIELMHPPGQPSLARIRKGRLGTALLQLVIGLACAAIGYWLHGHS
jgi:hypothetical protein